MTQYTPGIHEIFDYENSILQTLVNYAYKEVVKREEMITLSKAEFWTRLPFRARIAVFVGNLNFQVVNGGFTQWVENGYSECAGDLMQFLDKLPKNGPEVAAIVRCVTQMVADEDVEDFDEYHGADLSSLYYNLNDSFLNEVEAVLNMCKTDAELADWIKTAANNYEKNILAKLLFPSLKP
jgi:hypothetical protein